MSPIEVIVDFVPVVLAVVALVTLSKSFSSCRRAKDRLIYILAALASSVMLVAQLSWWSSKIFESRIVDLSFANYLWTVFNALVMIVFIMLSRKRSTDDNKDPT